MASSSLCYTSLLREGQQELEAAEEEEKKRMDMMETRLGKEDHKFMAAQRSLDKQRKMLRAVGR